MTTQNTTTQARRTFSQRMLNDEQVISIESIKAKAAELWDLIDQRESASSTTNPMECTRLFSLAKTNLEQTVLWATKGVSREVPDTNI